MNVIAGDATVEQMYALDLVRTPADFYDLTIPRLLMLDGWKEKSAQRFADSLRQSLSVPFERVLYAIGIRYVGEQTARDLARHFGSMDAIASASKEDLLAVPEVGGVIAESIYRFFRDPVNLNMVARLRAAGLNMTVESPAERGSDALSGMTIVISGNFSVSRDEMKAMIERNGGKNSSSVSGKTTYLLAGSKPGPEKIKKAGELGIRVIGEDEFYALLPGKPEPDAIPEGDGQLSFISAVCSES